MILAGNFKANHTRASTAEYLSKLDSLCDVKGENDSVVIFPPFTAFDKIALKHIEIGAQNGYPAEKGSYTGEICLDALREFDIDSILIGHSERRHIIKEPQEFMARKYEFFKRNSFKIFYCVGEPIEVRQKGIESVMSYIDKQFENIDVEMKVDNQNANKWRLKGWKLSKNVPSVAYMAAVHWLEKVLNEEDKYIIKNLVQTAGLIGAEYDELNTHIKCLENICKNKEANCKDSCSKDKCKKENGTHIET